MNERHELVVHLACMRSVCRATPDAMHNEVLKNVIDYLILRLNTVVAEETSARTAVVRVCDPDRLPWLPTKRNSSASLAVPPSTRPAR
jgi:hypothetical protein